MVCTHQPDLLSACCSRLDELEGSGHKGFYVAGFIKFFFVQDYFLRDFCRDFLAGLIFFAGLIFLWDCGCAILCETEWKRETSDEIK